MRHISQDIRLYVVQGDWAALDQTTNPSAPSCPSLQTQSLTLLVAMIVIKRCSHVVAQHNDGIPTRRSPSLSDFYFQAPQGGLLRYEHTSAGRIR